MCKLYSVVIYIYIYISYNIYYILGHYYNLCLYTTFQVCIYNLKYTIYV